MPSILVLEQDPRSLERIHHTLGAAGWRIRAVGESGQAFQAATAERPDLVIVGAGVSGADAVASSFSRRAGGPGVLGLLPPGAPPSGFAGLAADELLAQPFSDQELLAAVQRAGTAPRPVAAAPKPPRPESKLTSQDIFGDVLAEMEMAGDEPEPAPAPAPAAAPPIPPAPRPAPPRPKMDDDEVNRRLENTLSGVFGSDPGRPRPPAPAPPPVAPAPPRPATPQATAPAPSRAAAPASRRPDSGGDEDIDAILSRTLGNLDPRTRPAAPRPAAVPPAPAPPPVSATTPPGEGTAVRRAPKESGLSQLEELTRNLRMPTAAAAPQAARPAAPPPAAPPVASPAPAMPAAAAPPVPVFEPEPEPLPELEPAELPSPASMFGADPFDLADLDVPPPVELPGPEPVTEPEPEPPFELVDLDFEPEPLPVAVLPEPEPESEPEIVPEPEPVLPELDLEPLPELAGAGAPAGGSGDFAATQLIPVLLDDSTLNMPGAERFGQYTLLEKIAAGGMAEVWKARMRGVEGFQKTVAIKKILPHITDNSEFVGMFIDEAKLAAQLSHPNIVHIYDLGKIGRDYYIAMEYVEGKDLRSLLNAARRKGLPLPVGLALLIASRLASALDYAHRKRDFEGKELGLVHRDVSPQNVLLTHEGDVKLCDFGIAKAVSKAGQTQMGSLKGKLQYMSPEQAWGRPVDSRSDIFSLGTVLFEMLTGERLFSGDSEMSILEAVRQGRIRTPRDVDPTIPAEVDEIVARSLAYDARDRFQSAGEMMQRLDSVLHTLAPSPGPGELAAFLERVLAPEPSSDVMFIPPQPAPLPAPAPLPVAAPAPQRLPDVEVPPSLFVPEPPFPATAAAPVSPLQAGSPVLVEAVAPVGEVHVEETGGRKSRLFLVIAIVVLLAAVLATFFFLRGRGGSDTPPPAEQPAAATTAPATQPPPPAATTPAPVAPAAVPAAEQVDVEAILKEELAKREKEIRSKYEAEEKRLERELAKARKNAQAEDGQPPPPRDRN